MRRKKEEAEQTRECILNAAVALFAEKGVTATSLEEIARAAGVTRGAIYWHFKNKTEIFDALHNCFCTPLTDMIAREIESNSKDTLAQMKNLCIELLLDLENKAGMRQAIMVFLAKFDYPEELAPYKDKHNAEKAESQKLFTRFFEKAQAENRIAADINAEMLTRALNCYMKGIIIEHLNDPQRFKMKEQAPALVSFFFDNFEKS